MKGLLLLRADTKNMDPNVLKTWTQLYCDIWKEPPWNENFWKPHLVLKDFRNELSRPHGEAFLALVYGVSRMMNGRPCLDTVGFTHGYSVSIQEMREIAGNGGLNVLFKRRKRIYYVDELGVAKEYRGRGISLVLTRSLIETAKESGLTCVALRTDKQAVVARKVYGQLGFVEMPVQDTKHPERTYWVLEI